MFIYCFNVFSYLFTSEDVTIDEMKLALDSIISKSGLILATYCMRYPHAMPFLWNKIPYSLPKAQKTHAA